MTPEQRRTLIFVLLLCFVFLTGVAYLARYMRPSGMGWGREEPVIPSHPDAQNELRHKQEMLGWQSLTFEVNKNYPSTAVFDYYRGLLKSEGYSPIPTGQEPTWQPTDMEEGKRRLIMTGYWVDPEGLRVLQLDVSCVEEFTRDPESGRLISQEILPGQRVELTLSRKVFLPSDEG
ncbi:MAG: hypothetical protein GTO55_01175 [Armatimonadetes bacterium]|nr:hypothetical protein [Armatimonadota bacterium]NIM22893.1 hypothetical protein [Armatimonadota bacterium]NIM66760.1 hypothetical protein [Armatimonadota bacterium]NIM75307.1 hypothetical protein [Armatimonadota bacterium]NIN04956.1 hypothetical protein [Armatimonadota bacterium]